MRSRIISTFILMLLAVPMLVSGCHFLRLFPNVVEPKQDGGLSTEAETSFYRIPPYVFLADFNLNDKLPVLQDLALLRKQIHAEVDLPLSSRMIKVHLFENRENYEKYMKQSYPNLPDRRAFFVAMPQPIGGSEELMVFTYWGERIQQDLRHELTHAVLHSVLKDVPLWLDEGLAEYFENPPQWAGVNHNHLEQLKLKIGIDFQPDLARLEKLSEVQDMSPAEYREAWAWVHYMIRGNPKARTVLINYLKELQTNPQPGSLQQRLIAAVPHCEQEMLHHLSKLNTVRPTGNTVSK